MTFLPTIFCLFLLGSGSVVRGENIVQEGKVLSESTIQDETTNRSYGFESPVYLENWGCMTKVTPEECSKYAEIFGKHYCFKCGYASWGKDGNNRPQGCFMDDDYQQTFFYNPGGDNYKGQVSKIHAVCKKENNWLKVLKMNNCVTKITPEECSKYAKTTGKHYCFKCGYSNWGKYGNMRPQGCFMDIRDPHTVYYNPGGRKYKGWNNQIRAICYPNCIAGIDPEGCKKYATAVGKKYCFKCGYTSWGYDGNLRPKGCFYDANIPSTVFYNPGGEKFTSRKKVHPICGPGIL